MKININSFSKWYSIIKKKKKKKKLLHIYNLSRSIRGNDVYKTELLLLLFVLKIYEDFCNWLYISENLYLQKC